MKVGTEPGNLLTLAAQLNDIDQQCYVLSLSMSVCVDTICDGGSPLWYLFVLGLVSKAVEPCVLFTLGAMIGAMAGLGISLGDVCTCVGFMVGVVSVSGLDAMGGILSSPLACEASAFCITNTVHKFVWVSFQSSSIHMSLVLHCVTVLSDMVCSCGCVAICCAVR
jgi:hypothetical protein